MTSAVYPYTYGQVDDINLIEPIGYNPPDIKVLFPNGGEQFKKGEDIVVKWASRGIDEINIRAFYYDANGEVGVPDGRNYIFNEGECRITYEPVFASIGSFTVTGGDTGRCGVLPDSNRIRILISGNTRTGNTISDTSDNYFSITK